MRYLLVILLLIVAATACAGAADTASAPFKPVYFAYDSIRLDKAARDTLAEVARFFASHPDPSVTLIGNTDDRYSDEYAMALGERMASTAKGVLVRQGVPANRITVLSYGNSKPALSGHSRHARRLNRRVDIVLNSPAADSGGSERRTPAAGEGDP